MISSIHLRWLCNTFALPRAMKVTEVTEARLCTGAGLYCQVETKDGLNGGWGINMQETYHRKKNAYFGWKWINWFICSFSLTLFKQMYLEIYECWTYEFLPISVILCLVLAKNLSI